MDVWLSSIFLTDIHLFINLSITAHDSKHIPYQSTGYNMPSEALLLLLLFCILMVWTPEDLSKCPSEQLLLFLHCCRNTLEGNFIQVKSDSGPKILVFIVWILDSSFSNESYPKFWDGLQKWGGKLGHFFGYRFFFTDSYPSSWNFW